MAQAGLHGMVGLAVRRWTPEQENLMLGIVLGSLLPDFDNYGVAIATVVGAPTEVWHRTFTHSLFFVGGIWVVAYLVGAITAQKKWRNLGIGLGIGVALHIFLDIFIWFAGVYILWPVPYEFHLWANVSPPAWWMALMMPAEFFFFALLFAVFIWMAQKQETNEDVLLRVKIWTAVQMLLFIIFTVLVYTLDSGFMTIYGATYLISLTVSWIIVIKLKDTIEWHEPIPVPA